MNAPIRTGREKLRHLRWALRLVWNAAPRWFSAWAVLLVLQGLIPPATVYAVKLVVDAAAGVVGNAGGWDGGIWSDAVWSGVEPMVWPGLALGGLLLLTELLKAVQGWIQLAQSELLQDRVKDLIHEQASALDLAFYESSDYHDLLAKANGEAGTRCLSLLQSLGGIVQTLITLVGVASLLIPYGAWLPVVLLLSTLPALLVVVRHKVRHHGWWDQTTESRRWADYYDKALTLPLTIPEVRMFGLSEPFRGAYRGYRQDLREGRLDLQRSQSLATLWAGGVGLVVAAGVMGWMLLRAASGTATLGDLALFYQVFSQSQSLMRSFFGSIGTLYADLLFAEHLHAFLSLTPTLQTPASPNALPLPPKEAIRFENVGFRYPGSEAWALRNFSMTIPVGTTAAIVGPNGAGKSTLAKLLCRFYDPQEGRVTIDGVDLRTVAPTAPREGISILFQYPIRYVDTARGNIRMGNLVRPDDDASVREAAREAEADAFLQALPNGYDTLLNKQFKGGVELSGGQWQRVALARAFYRQSPIVVLDEPTSYMDSWAEASWLARFRRLVEGRTALIITHRFTTAMRADVIHVVEEGRVIESGTHAQLLALNGRYAESWSAQMADATAGDVGATATGSLVKNGAETNPAHGVFAHGSPSHRARSASSNGAVETSSNGADATPSDATLDPPSSSFLS